MLGKWIEKQEDLPDGLMVIGEDLRPLLEGIRNLDADDLAEVRAFIGYLSDRKHGLTEHDSRVSAKICDFMAGGMLKVS